MNIRKFSNMIKVAVNKMVAGEGATPIAVITTTGTNKLRPDNCAPGIAFLEYGYCDPYFGWLIPAMAEAVLLLEKASMSEQLAVRLWNNGWTRAFLVELYERNDEEWKINHDGEAELYDKLGFNVRTREGFVQWLLSGERLYGYRLPGHEALLATKESLENVRG